MKYLKLSRLNVWFGLFVLLPIALSILYYGFIASDQYISESRFVVKGRSERASSLTGIASLVQATGLSSGQEQTNEVIDYIRSRGALTQLERHVKVRDKFELADADIFSRYPAIGRSDFFENLYLYYQKQVTVKLDSNTGLAVLSVKAFTPTDAQQINASLLGLSESFVNQLNEKARDKAISEAEQRVAKAEQRVRDARTALAAFRNNQQLVDPLKQASGVLAISDKLVSEQAALQAQLDVMTRTAPRNPSIPALRDRIAAIGSAIAGQNGRAVGNSSALTSKMGGYDNLTLEQEFSAQTLTSASAALEQARTDALRQQYYLERVVEPNAPDMSRYPQRLWQILTVAGIALCLYFIGWMLVVGIIEHSPDH